MTIWLDVFPTWMLSKESITAAPGGQQLRLDEVHRLRLGDEAPEAGGEAALDGHDGDHRPLLGGDLAEHTRSPQWPR